MVCIELRTTKCPSRGYRSVPAGLVALAGLRVCGRAESSWKGVTGCQRRGRSRGGTNWDSSSLPWNKRSFSPIQEKRVLGRGDESYRATIELSYGTLTPASLKAGSGTLALPFAAELMTLWASKSCVASKFAGTNKSEIDCHHQFQTQRPTAAHAGQSHKGIVLSAPTASFYGEH